MPPEGACRHYTPVLGKLSYITVGWHRYRKGFFRSTGRSPGHAREAGISAAVGLAFAKLLLEPVDLLAEARDPAGHRNFVDEEDSPNGHPRGEQKMEVSHVQLSVADVSVRSALTLRPSADTRKSSNS